MLSVKPHTLHHARHFRAPRTGLCSRPRPIVGRGVSSRQIPAYPIAYDAGKAFNAAAKRAHQPDTCAEWAGQGARRLPPRKLLPAAELIAVLARGGAQHA